MPNSTGNRGRAMGDFVGYVQTAPEPHGYCECGTRLRRANRTGVCALCAARGVPVPSLPDVDYEPAYQHPTRRCKRPECDQPLPADATIHRAYCSEPCARRGRREAEQAYEARRTAERRARNAAKKAGNA